MRLETGAEWSARRSVGRSQAIALGIILLIAIVARIVGLNASLWYDEVLTVVEYVRLPLPRLVSTFDSLNNHMFYSILARGSAMLFGETAWSVRLPAVIFGVLSIPVHWQIARRYVGPGEALLVALLLAISYHHIWFSQNARGYTMLLFFTSASVLCFLDGFELGSRRAWILFALAATGAIYTHLSALFFYAALGLVYLFVLARALLRSGARPARAVPVAAPIAAGASAIALSLLLNLPIIGAVAGTVAEVSESTANSGQALAEWQNPLRALVEVGRSMGALGPLIPLVVTGAFVTVVTGAVDLARRAPLLVAIYVLQIPVTIAILTMFEMRIWPRYFFNEIGVVYLFAVHGAMVIAAWAGVLIGRFTGWSGARAVMTGAAAVATVIVSLGLLPRNYQLPKQPFTAARDFVESRRAPGDAVGAIGHAGYVLDSYYRPGWRSAEDLASLRALEAAPGRTWILVAFPNQTAGARAELMREVEERYQRVWEFPGTLGDGAIRVYRSEQ